MYFLSEITGFGGDRERAVHHRLCFEVVTGTGTT